MSVTEERPYVNVPEGPGGANVYRPMNDEEYAQWLADQEAASTAADAQAWRDFYQGVADRLSKTDWTQLPDTPPESLGQHENGTPVMIEEWVIYRDDVRDLLNSVTDPTAVVWPVPPAVIPPLDGPPSAHRLERGVE